METVELKPTIATRAAMFLVVVVVVALSISSGTWWLAIAVGLAFAVICIAIGRRRIVVDDTGVRARGVFGAKTLPWSAITHYTYYSALAGGLFWVGKRDTRIRGNRASVVHHVLVVASPAARIRIDSNYRRAEVAVQIVLDRLHAQLATKADFAPFAIEADGLHHSRAGVLPWPKLEEIRLDGQTPPRLQVMARGKSFPWRTEKMSRVHDGLLFVEQLVERGVAVDLGGNQAVHDRLHGMLERNAGLPRAEVVVRK